MASPKNVLSLSIGKKARSISNRGCPYCSGTRVHADNCLENLYPEISQEWHPTKNGAWTPKDFTRGSSKRVWWQCSKGHEYRAQIVNRTKENGTGCPYCAHKLPSPEYNLKTEHSNVAAEWHPTKNGKLKPTEVLPGTGKKIWWLCEKKHEYEASCLHRSHGTGCPYCSNQKIAPDNSLEFLFPEIAKLWHPTMNKKVLPSQIFPGSNKQYWWVCKRGHEYQTSVHQKTNPVGCTVCSRRRVSKENNLLRKFPQVAAEWDVHKNGQKNADQIHPGSHMKAWWICDKGHSWDAVIRSRTKWKTGCPFCSGRREKREKKAVSSEK